MSYVNQKTAKQQDQQNGKTGNTPQNQPHGASTEASSVCLVLKVQGKMKHLAPEDLQDDEIVCNLQAKCAKAKSPVDVGLVHLLDQPVDVRVGCLDLIASLTCACRFHPCRNGIRYRELLSAILSMMADPSVDLDRYERAKSAALEWAVLRYPAALEGPCQQILKRMRELGVPGVSLRDLIRDAREIQRGLAKQGTCQAVNQTVEPVRSQFDDAPVGEEIVVPLGWMLSKSGIGGDREGGKVSIPTPVLITERHLDVNGGTELVTVAWYRDGGWKTRTVDRAAIASSRAIVDALAPYGVPVTSNNAADLVQYMCDFESGNLERLPITQVSKQLGWQGDGGALGFLCGKTLITMAAEAGNGKDGNQSVRFCGADEGDDQIAAGFHKKGRFEKWKEGIAKISPFPKVKLALYASFVPVLLSVFKARNFVLDYSGKTTVGKTTCLRVGASTWGDPDDNNPAGLIKTWDGTATFRERVPAVLNHLPYFLDDNKHARHPEDVASTVYSVVQGRGRGRGSIKGVARQDTWHTVLFTSGEQPATSFTEDGGTRARVLSLWGSPFKKVDAETQKLVRRLNDQLKRHYGHAGPRFVQYILDHRDQWGDWRKDYLEKVNEYENLAGANQFAGRMATDFAAITVAARLAHKALGLPWEYTDPIKPLWKELAKEANEADRAGAALRYVVDWAYSHQEEFFGRNKDKEKRQPHSGWAGRWDKSIPLPEQKGDQENWPWIGFIPARLRAVLQEGGFEPESIIRTWRDEKWLAATKEKKAMRFEVKARVGETTPWLMAITRAAVERVSR